MSEQSENRKVIDNVKIPKLLQDYQHELNLELLQKQHVLNLEIHNKQSKLFIVSIWMTLFSTIVGVVLGFLLSK